MTKYNFILHKSERDRVLELLGGSAIVDVTVNNWSADAQDKEILTKISLSKDVCDKLRSFASFAASSSDELEPLSLSFDSVEQIIDGYTTAATRIEQLTPQILKVNREIDEAELWGDFSSDLVDKLASDGYHIYFYSAKDIDPSWSEQYSLAVCGEKSSSVLFVVVSEQDTKPVIEGANSEKQLTSSFSELREQLASLEKELNYNRSYLLAASESISKLEEYNSALTEQLSELKIIKTNHTAADGELIIIEGWAPDVRTAEVDALFDANPMVVMVKEKPQEGENPPILLKNNAFARLCEVVTRLYSMPKYQELDLTPFFAPFFVFFVGICFCDLGYGLLTGIGAAVAYFKLKDTALKDIAMLVMWCSFAAIVMGGVTGVFFGLSLAEVPQFSHIPFLGQMDMFSFSLVVGVIQILYAMVIKAYSEISRKGLKYGITTISWALILILSGVAYFSADLGIAWFSMSSVAYKVVLGVLLLLYILFSDPTKKNLLANFGGGLWAFYNALTGILGDTLSYIRLFALGLSGGIIAGVFNDLAIGMSPDIPVVKYIVMILIMLFGHSINLFMSAISSFVHPLRLTLVEFYKCAGFEGGGREYQPFKKSAK